MGVQTYEPGHSRMYTITRCIGRYVKTSDYVALEQENAALKARLERLSAPVSDEDVNGLAMILAMLHEDVKPPTRADIKVARMFSLWAAFQPRVNSARVSSSSDVKGGNDEGTA